MILPKVFQPPSPKEGAKKIPKWSKVLIFVLIIGGGLIYLFFFSAVFQIKNIVIENLPAGTSFDKFKGQNIFLVGKAVIETEVKTANKGVQEVHIARGFPDTLKISAILYQPKIIWKSQAHNFLVNQDGIAINESEEATDFPVVVDLKDLKVEPSQQITSKNFVDFVVLLFAKFPEKEGFKIVNFEVAESIFQVDALTDQGWKVKFDTTRDVASQLEALGKLLAEHKDEIHEYADVRVEGRVYYK